MREFDDLPISIAEIAEVIGREKALFLIGQLPRSPSRSWRVNLYIPKRMPLDHWLIKLLGFPDAEKMRREFGGIILQPSNCGHVYRLFRNKEVRRMADAGIPVHQIADAVDLTTRQVRNIISERPPEDGGESLVKNSKGAPDGVSRELVRTG